MTQAPCPLCQAAQPAHDEIFHAYAHELSAKHGARHARRLLKADISERQLIEHLLVHPYTQPSPAGKLHHRRAVQEAMNSLPTYAFRLLRICHRLGAISHKQIFDTFYLSDSNVDHLQLQQKITWDLGRMAIRGFLYRYWPDPTGPVCPEDRGPYYLLGRQSAPVLERLDGIEVPLGRYITNAAQVEAHHLEEDSRKVAALVRIRSSLYERTLSVQGRTFHLHCGTEHWQGPDQLAARLQLGDGQQLNFRGGALLGLRVEDVHPAGMRCLLPLWVEYDRGSRTPAEVAQRALSYAQWFRSAEFGERYKRLQDSRCPGPLLLICDSAPRRAEISAHLHARLQGRRVPIYLADRPTLMHDPWADGIAHPVGEPRAVSLLAGILDDTEVLWRNLVIPPTGRLWEEQRQALSAVHADRAAASAARAYDLSGWES